MKVIIEFLKKLWGTNSPFRHAVTAFVSLNLAVPLAQVGAWAQTKGATPLPDWHQLLADLAYAAVAAVIAAFLKWAQNKRAFPEVKPQ